MFLWRSNSKRQLQPRAKESLAAWSFVRPLGNRAGRVLAFATAGVEEARAPVHEQVEHVLQIGRAGCGEVMVLRRVRAHVEEACAAVRSRARVAWNPEGVVVRSTGVRIRRALPWRHVHTIPRHDLQVTQNEPGLRVDNRNWGRVKFRGKPAHGVFHHRLILRVALQVACARSARSSGPGDAAER